MILIVLLGQFSVIVGGSKKDDRREVTLKELVSIWRKEGGWYPLREQPDPKRSKEQQIHSVVRSIVGGLKSLGLLSQRSGSLSSLKKPLERNRLSTFLYNISMYLQEMGAELDDRQPSFGDDDFWEKLLQSFFQSEAGVALGQWHERVSPRPSFKLQDFFLSLRGSPHWDGLLGLVQSIMSLSERQPQRPILNFVSQNWKTISALFETALQALVSGTYGQASAGLQGFICVLKGRNDCAFNLSWLQQLLSFLETRNWKPVVSLHPAVSGDQRDGALSTGRFKPFSVPPEVLQEERLFLNRTQSDLELGSLASMQTLLLQALSRSGTGERAVQFAERNPALLQGLDGLRRGLMHRIGSAVYSNLRRKVSHMTMVLLDDVSGMVGEPQHNHQGICSVGDLRQLILWGVRHNLTWNAQAMGFSSQGPPSSPPFMSCSAPEDEKKSTKPRPSHRSRHFRSDIPKRDQGEVDLSVEILEAACNDSIPGLTGVSNFTVFLYCNLFDGSDGSLIPGFGHARPDLHVTCSNAAWYLSAAEDDFLWVHVCSEFFAHEFNNTVCANSSFWIQRAHQASATQDNHYFNQSSIDDLCVKITAEVTGGSGADASKDCLELLGSRSLSAHDFRKCFLPNDSALILSLCGNESFPFLQDGSWAAEYCSKIFSNSSSTYYREKLCDYQNWREQHFINSTLLKLCEDTVGLKDYICRNTSFYFKLIQESPSLLGYCTDLEMKHQSKCVLQQIFDMLPAPYDFDTSQLCGNPIPVLLGALQKLSLCEGAADERVGWLATVSYMLRVLDFVVGFSAGHEEGEHEVRQGLGQAILLSSLLDNASFWAALQPNASISVLQSVSIFLKREQNPSVKEDLLSCFSPVLWDLIQKEENSSALRFLIQEYLQMPKESIRTLVLSAEKDAVKRFLSHVHQSWDQLQVEKIQVSQKEQQAMETMTAAFIHKFPHVTPELFVDLSQFIPYMSVTDIMSFPASLMVNESVLLAIRDHSPEMKSLQKQAFVKRLLQSSMVGDVPSWPPYFLNSILPLLPHLPVSHFQQLTSLQLSPLVELLGNSSLDATRGRHVLRTLFSKRNFTSDNLLRLGILMCYVNPEDLHPFISSALTPALWQQLAHCVTEGHVSASGRLSHWLGIALRPLNATAMSLSSLESMRGLLPQLGVTFMQTISTRELLEVFTLPGVPALPPAQAFLILNKISEETNVSANTLCRLKPLFPGLGPSVLRRLVVPESTDALECECWSSLLSELQPAHQAMMHNVLLLALNRTSANITLHLRCLLPFFSLKKLMTMLDGETILQDISLYKALPWSHHQTQVLFKKVHQIINITRQSVQGLGRIAGGMSCDWLRQWTNESDFGELLQFVSELPGGLRPALRKCIVEELNRRPDVDVNAFDASFVVGLPVKMIEYLSNDSLTVVLKYIQQHFIDFLHMPRHKQMALADKAIDVLGISEDRLSGASVDLLGPFLPFLDRDVFSQIDREALKVRLEELREYCLPSDSRREIATLLTDRSVLGEPSSWTVGDIERMGRLVLTLSSKQIRSLPLDNLGMETVEQVLQDLWHWQDSELGQACMDLKDQREKLNSFLHRIIRGRRRRRREPVPSCADIKGTFPSAWQPSQLSRMDMRDLKECVEFMGQDSSLNADQRYALWTELRQVYRPVSLLRPEQVLELGCIVTEMNERELQSADLSNQAIVAHLGNFNMWGTKKMRAAVLGILRRRGKKPEELGMEDLVSLGHLLCGLTSSQILQLDPYNLSLAALFLRETVLPCSEQQTAALTSRLFSPHAFGPVSSWGAEVFTEIGTLAAGLEDMVLSALIREQMEGLTPEAIALIPPRKMAVVFSAAQLSWLSSEQAFAVTEEQWAELDSEQRHAVSMAQYEGEIMLGHRGKLNEKLNS
ncbi:stereocilin [Chanos chanos]|uniref:Stereocilin n=1 Tax=Chanos chanos TaxID=29144 RepID=A0A6J2UPH1_CHACN|nr:stereocilin [Chanos chanos]